MSTFRLPKFKARNKSSIGLTLIEVLIVAVMVSIVGSALYATFAQGLRLWKYATHASPQIDFDIAYEKLIQDMHNVIPHDEEPWLGSSQRVSFFTLAPVLSNTEVPALEAGAGVQRVIYQYLPTEKKLVRYSEPYTAFLNSSSGKNLTAKVILTDLENCTISYQTGMDGRGASPWSVSWKSKCLPRAVKIQLKKGKGQNAKEVTQIYNLFTGNCVKA